MSEHLKNTKVIWQGQTKTVEFSYVDFQGNKTRRKVDVSHVLFDADNNYLYLQGHCHLKNAERHFRVDNIVTMLLVGSKRIDVHEWLSESLGIDDCYFDGTYSTDKSSTTDHFKDPETAALLRKVVEQGKDRNSQTPLYAKTTPEPSNRKISLLLGFGIFFIPVIFSWVTLKKGYSTKARIISFVWLSVFGILTLLSDDKKTAAMPPAVHTQPKNTIDTVVKANDFDGLSDCKLAQFIIKDYMPLMISLGKFIDENPNMTYQQTNVWKQTVNFDAVLAEIDAKYPVITRSDMHNAQVAKGLNFRVGQIWRDLFFSLKKSNNEGPLKLDQFQLVQDELTKITANCAAEFGDK
ncbi:WYL domain-containing protein [Shewanella baltica]|uniref:WYL domain-containing protein n=1 Tax=Shewanella baltica TaxID=62322 RepID=UPI0039B0BF95